MRINFQEERIQKFENQTYEKKRFTYPHCVIVNGTSIELDARRLSFTISANLAKSVSVSAKRADRRDSNRRTSSNFFLRSIGGCE